MAAAQALTSGATVARMNLGVRLGPFRISTNGRGRTTAGVSAGPFSLSGQVGGQSHQVVYPVHRITMAQAIELAEREGWHLAMRRQWTVRMDRGWHGRCIYEVQGGVQVRPAMSGRVTNLCLLGVIALGLALCWLFINAMR